MRLSACAKINLFLRVTGSRRDGYHTLVTLFQQISLADELLIKKKRTPGIELSVFVDGRYQEDLSVDNTILRSYAVASECTGTQHGVSVTLQKRIPVGAGLGGGSSDAAAFIRGFNKISGLGLILEQEQAIASRVGADVPFFLTGGAAIGQDRGDLITPIRQMPTFWVIVIYPGVPVSTPFIFQKYDEQQLRAGGAHAQKKLTHTTIITNIKRCIKTKNTDRLAPLLYNDLAPIAQRHCPEITHALHQLTACGVHACGMSGSGSSVFGIVFSRTDAERVVRSLRSSGVAQVWACESTSEGIRIR